MRKTLTFLLFAFILSGCIRRPQRKGNDRTENAFYAEYVRIYHTYGHVPLDSTQAALKAYLVKFPNSSVAWTFLGRVWVALDRKDSARAAYRTALSYDHHYGPALAGLGTMYSNEGKLDSGALLINEGIAAGDSSYYNYLNLAATGIKKGDTAAARNAAAHFVQVDTLDSYVLECLAVIFSELNNVPQSSRALALLEKRNARDPLLNRYLAKEMTAVEYLYKKQEQNDDGK